MVRKRRIHYTKTDKAVMWDRGKEMADHKRFTLDASIKVYFCDPNSPWQRGSDENTNGLLRQYFPGYEPQGSLILSSAKTGAGLILEGGNTQTWPGSGCRLESLDPVFNSPSQLVGTFGQRPMGRVNLDQFRCLETGKLGT